MTARLTSQSELPAGVAFPGYRREDHGSGIVHIGLGAFHKSHLAVYTDDALAARGGDWRIVGVSLRSDAPSRELNPQDCLYTTIEHGVDSSRARVIGSIASAYCLGTDRAAVLNALCAPTTRIVSLTVTEKGYGLDRRTGRADPAHPAIAADLDNPATPTGVAGLLVWALAERRAAGVPPFTVLCCDNLPDNGLLVRGLLVDFARRARPGIAGHIASGVAFPATMVDRITPSRTAETLRLAKEMTGYADAAAIESEAFRQWVVQDHFPLGRPAWEAGGALFVEDVRPFEEMKLRMLNGTHSMIAYAGFIAGHEYVRDVMADASFAALVDRYLAAAAATLGDLPGVDLRDYARQLAARFANPHLGHQTYQIAMDGSEKMPQRVFAAAREAQRRGGSVDLFAFAAAAWMRYTLGRTDAGEAYDLRDPMEDRLRPSARSATSAEGVIGRLHDIPGLVPGELAASEIWCGSLRKHLRRMIVSGMAAAVRDAVD